MPLVRFQVRNEYGLGAQELYKDGNGEEPKAILDGVAVAGLVGILRQLGDLAEFAAEVFHGLQEQVVTTASRSQKMLVRVQQIEAALPPLEKAVLAQKSHIHFAYTAGYEWHPRIRVKQKHFIHSDLPSFIMDSYEECHDPPRLHLLDKFDTGGPGSCLRRYSDPSFFRKAITRSEPMTAEKVQREKRGRKSKKKSSRWRNEELSHAVSTSQCSGRMKFGSPNSNGQSSTAETISTIHMRSKSELGDRPMSFDSRTRSGYFECVFEGSSSMQQEGKGHKPKAMLKMRDGGTTDSIFTDEQKLSPVNFTTPGSSQDLNSSSVTWDEKTEILDPNNHHSDHTVGGISLELLQERFNPARELNPAKELSEAATDTSIDPENIVCVAANVQESLSEDDEFDEVGSEPDKYADALNTLESEAETDSECQTKVAVEKPLTKLKREEKNIGETCMLTKNPEMSSVEFRTEPYSSSYKQIPPNHCNSVSSEDFIHTPLLKITSEPSDRVVSVDIDQSEGLGGLSVSKLDGSESAVHDPSSSLSCVPSSQPPLFDKIVSTESEGSLQEVSGVSSINVWTNGGLLGLEPSKPPDYTSNSQYQNGMAFSEDDANGHSFNIVLAESHPNGLVRKVNPLVKATELTEKSPNCEVQRDRSPVLFNSIDIHSNQLTRRSMDMTVAVDYSRCNASYQDKQSDDMLQEDSLVHLSTISEAGLAKSNDACQSCSLSNPHGYDLKGTRVVTSQNEVTVVAGGKCPSNESSLKKLKNSASMFGLGQRFFGNVYRDSVVHDDKPHYIHQTGNGKLVHQTLPEKILKKQLQNGSLVNSLPTSPPLEHMKISFHPLDSFKTSKLRLKFPGGHHFHESIKDVIFPSFQLLPEPAILLQDTGSESENDTFGRSSSYLSEEHTSEDSESSSEQWESDEMPDNKNHEIYDALHRVSSVESISSAFELEGISNGSNRFTPGFKSSDPHDGLKKFHYDSLFDLPSFDTVSSAGNQQERKCDSAKKDHQDSELQYSTEPVPPPPPFPPVEWRVTKPQFGVAENEENFTSEVNCSNNLLVLEAATEPSKPDSPKHPHINDISDCSPRNKQDPQSLYDNKEANHTESCRGVDEREDLLNQIRSKSFSLRRTEPAKTTSQDPITNNKVVAILEKANAIRQAHVGSDEGGDNWSDG